jgi:hypothetical protein
MKIGHSLVKVGDSVRLQFERVKTLAAYRRGSWRQLPIVECGQPLVQVPEQHCEPYYADVMQLTTDRRVFLRQEVLERFLGARQTLLEEGYDLKVYDG